MLETCWGIHNNNINNNKTNRDDRDDVVDDNDEQTINVTQVLIAK